MCDFLWHICRRRGKDVATKMCATKSIQSSSIVFGLFGRLFLLTWQRLRPAGRISARCKLVAKVSALRGTKSSQKQSETKGAMEHVVFPNPRGINVTVQSMQPLEEYAWLSHNMASAHVSGQEYNRSDPHSGPVSDGYQVRAVFHQPLQQKQKMKKKTRWPTCHGEFRWDTRAEDPPTSSGEREGGLDVDSCLWVRLGD